MSTAGGLVVRAVDLPNPDYRSPSDQTRPTDVDPSISFAFASESIVTLSTTGTDGSDVTGYLYVPNLASDDPCNNLSAPYIPANVTRQANLPGSSSFIDLIGLAPWISSQCTLNYFAAARGDPIRGFIFFPPTNSTMSPPDANSSAWDLGDNGAWMRDNKYPVWAISGLDGVRIARASGQYSGNLTQAPYGSNLSTLYDARDYVRLASRVLIEPPFTYPSLWVFLIIVLGILLAIVALTILIMQYIQRRRRQSLRRRVANGEVDLEALGIKRLTVPQDVLNNMPLYAYGSTAPIRPSPPKTAVTHVEEKSESNEASNSANQANPTQRAANQYTSSFSPSPLSQPTCAICLDDFVAAQPAQGIPATIVRELPCQHIFHPECVDAFLSSSSSLCPMCKKSALPRGYCPRLVTNAMVRRERIVRRIRERVDGSEHQHPGGSHDGNLPGLSRSNTFHGFYGRMQHRVDSRLSQLRRARTRNDSLSHEDHEFGQPMTDMLPPSSSSPGQPQHHTNSPNNDHASAAPPSNPNGRREWARQRALAMLGPRPAPMDPDAEEARRVPAWKRTMRNVFPVGR